MAKSKFSQLDKSEQKRIRKEAYKRWSINPVEDKLRLAKIARDIGMSSKEIQEYMIKDKWHERYNKSKNDIKKETKQRAIDAVEGSGVTDIKKSAKKIDEILENANIPDKWQLFIMHYLKSFNAIQAAKAIGYTSKSNSVPFNILNDERVKKAIREIKLVMATDIYVTAHDILSEYVKIAYADMTDYVEFDARRVKLKNSQDVDGRLITEVKQGKDGVTIKLADKMKAMEKLEKLFDVIPDKRLELDNKKYELNKQLVEKQLKENGGSGSNVVIIRDI